MSSHIYVLEKLTQAVYALATGEGDVRSRINESYHEFCNLNEEDFPEQLRDKRSEIERLLTTLPGRIGYIIPDNIEKMTNETAVEIAKLILEMYIELKELVNHKHKQ